MLSYKKILLLIVFGLANQQLLVSIEVSIRTKINRRDFKRVLKESQLEMKAKRAAEEAKKEQEQEEKRKQEEQEVQEELAELQRWIDAPLNPSFGDLSGEDLVRLQDVFAGTPDNSTDLPDSLSQMSAQDVLRLQQEREAQATEAAAKQAEQQRIKAERTEQSKRLAAQKKAELQLEREQRERAARIKLYQQQQAAEKEAKRAQAVKIKAQEAADRVFYNPNQRERIMEDMRTNVVQHKGMDARAKREEINRAFGIYLLRCEKQNLAHVCDQLEEDRQTLMSEMTNFEREKDKRKQEAADAQLAAQLQRAQELAADGSSTAALSKKDVVTLADVKNKFAQMAGGQPSFARGDDQIVIPDLTKADFLTMDSQKLGRLINQQDMKKTEASEHWVIGRVGDILQHAKYPYIFQRIVPVQYGANCGYHAMAHGFNIANNHLLGNPLETVSDKDLFIQENQMIHDGIIEENWKAFYSNSTNEQKTPIPLAIVTDKLEPMGQLGIQKISFPHLSTEEFLINTIKKEIEKDGRRAFVIVANTSSKGVHWYGLVILKHEDGNLQFVFIDSAGMTTENVGNGNVANATHLREDHRSSQNIYQLIKQLMKE
jgi:hypothetical protein